MRLPVWGVQVKLELPADLLEIVTRLAWKAACEETDKMPSGSAADSLEDVANVSSTLVGNIDRAIGDQPSGVARLYAAERNRFEAIALLASLLIAERTVKP